MANEKDIALLKQGVPAWNAWRRKSGDTVPDLSKANLEKLDLSGANLSGANLSQVNLAGSDVSHADFSGADLNNADLRRSDLLGSVFRGSNLHAANLSWAILLGADLRDANLVLATLFGTNLTGADLGGANLNAASVYETVFCDANLRNTKGLTSCMHFGPSSIDHRTLRRNGPLPSDFLRSCGLPDDVIDYLPPLNQPKDLYSYFISYSSADEEFAKRLHADLQKNNVRCWFAPEDMKIGDKIRTRIDEAIRAHDKLLLVLSQNSINSKWVEKEVETAFEMEEETGNIILFPVRLDDAIMESKSGWAGDIKRTRHIGDFRKWKAHDAYQASLERLLSDMRVEKSTGT